MYDAKHTDQTLDASIVVIYFASIVGSVTVSCYSAFQLTTHSSYCEYI